MNVLAIDPGAKGHRAKGRVRGATGCACAWFDGGALQGARFEALPYPPPSTESLAIVVERPQVDERTRYADPRDVLALSWAGAKAAAHVLGYARAIRLDAKIVELTPTEWKGSEPKPAHHLRLWSVLTPRERVALGGDAVLAIIEAAVEKGALSRWSKSGADYYPASFDAHNLLDAAALGCFYLGRLAKR